VLLTSEQVSAVGRALPLPAEVRLPMVQADMARALGLLDGQVVTALVEARNERLRLMLQNRAIELPARWRSLLGQNLQLQVQRLASGAVQLAPLAQQPDDPAPPPLPKGAQPVVTGSAASPLPAAPARWLLVNQTMAQAMGLDHVQVLAWRVEGQGRQLRWQQHVLDVPRAWQVHDGQTVGMWVRRLSPGVWALQPLTPIELRAPAAGAPQAAPQSAPQASPQTAPAPKLAATPPAGAPPAPPAVVGWSSSQAWQRPPTGTAAGQAAAVAAPLPAGGSLLTLASTAPPVLGQRPEWLRLQASGALQAADPTTAPGGKGVQVFDTWPSAPVLRTDQLDASAIRQALLSALGLWAPMVARARQSAVAEDTTGAPAREASQSGGQREWVFGLSLSFRDAPPVDMRLKREARRPNDDAPPRWEVHMHTQSEALGEVWVRTRLQGETAVEVTLWADRPAVVAQAKRWREHLARELQDASLQLTGFGAYPSSARPENSEPQIPVGSFLDISS
jgi:hypothetical protein